MTKTFYLSIALSLFFSACSKTESEQDKTFQSAKQELNISYGGDSRQKMDIYFPEGYNQNTPVVFLIHGGGFIAGTKESFSAIAKLFVAEGFISVNLSHRLVDGTGLDQKPPLHQASPVKVRDQVEDIASAVEKYKEAAVNWGTGSSKMYIAGHSAGGTLAMLYAQGTKNKGIRASGNFAGLTNLTLSEELYNNPPDHEYWPAVKELLYRMSGTEVNQSTALALMAISPNWVSAENKPGKPNITVMSRTNDKDLRFEPYFSSIKDAENYHQELKSYGTQSSYILMDTDHGFGSHPQDWAKAVEHIATFFKQN